MAVKRPTFFPLAVAALLVLLGAVVVVVQGDIPANSLTLQIVNGTPYPWKILKVNKTADQWILPRYPMVKPNDTGTCCAVLWCVALWCGLLRFAQCAAVVALVWYVALWWAGCVLV